MKFRITVEGQTFAVEVGDVHSRPVVVTVDGERFEVVPETDVDGPALRSVPQASSETSGYSVPAPLPAATATDGRRTVLTDGADRIVSAPIPGVIVAVSVQAGAEVKPGDELCVLEAMKMRNAIRATRAGRIASVRVSVGQHVKHREALIEYAE